MAFAFLIRFFFWFFIATNYSLNQASNFNAPVLNDRSKHNGKKVFTNKKLSRSKRKLFADMRSGLVSRMEIWNSAVWVTFKYLVRLRLFCLTVVWLLNLECDQKMFCKIFKQVWNKMEFHSISRVNWNFSRKKPKNNQMNFFILCSVFLEIFKTGKWCCKPKFMPMK